MTILAAGSFNVSYYRKGIPAAVKLAVMILQGSKAKDGVPFTAKDALDGNIQFDHDPALAARPYDTDAEDFIPPQHDHLLIEAKRTGKHLEKTTGRKEGAERTVTTRGSDVGEAARTRGIRDSDFLHTAAMARKAGDIPRAELYEGMVSEEGKKALARPKQRLRSRNNFRRGKRHA